MTGKDLIIYILENDLENEPIIENGKFIGLMSVGEAASKLNVGEETVKVWIKFGRLTGITMCGEQYVFRNALFKKLGSEK